MIPVRIKLPLNIRSGAGVDYGKIGVAPASGKIIMMDGVEDGNVYKGVTKWYYKLNDKKIEQWYWGGRVEEVDQIEARKGFRETRVINPNWVAFAELENSSGRPINSFRVKYIVPDDPLTYNLNLIFLFMGMQNTNRILQPVLQWGSSKAGGGKYWGIASWYAGGISEPPVYTELEKVREGEELVAFITLESAGSRGFTYRCGFEGRERTIRRFSDIEELKTCYITLESRGVLTKSDYPPAGKTTMQILDLRTAEGPITQSWRTDGYQTEIGEHASVSSGAQSHVDLHFGNA